MNKLWIPEMGKVRTISLSQRIRPVVFCHRGGQAGHYYIKPVDVFYVPFLWEPVVGSEKMQGGKRYTDIVTFHTIRERDRLTATVAEVLAQIPDQLLTSAVAFEGRDVPVLARVDPVLLANEHAALRDGYHTMITRIYF